MAFKFKLPQIPNRYQDLVNPFFFFLLIYFVLFLKEYFYLFKLTNHYSSGAALCIFIYLIFDNKKHLNPPNVKFLLIILLILFTSIFFSEHKEWSILRNINLLSLIALFLSFSNFEKKEISLKLLFATSIPIFLCVLIFILTAFSIDNYQDYNWFLYPPIFNHIRHFNYIFEVLYFIGIAFTLQKHRPFRFFGYFSILTSITFQAWSGARGAIICMILVHLLIFWKNRKRAIQYILAWPIGILISVIFNVNTFGMGFFQSFFERTILLQDKSLYQISTGRSYIWTNYFNDLMETPSSFIFGRGADDFALSKANMVISTAQPHNSILQLTSDFGFPICLTILGLMLVTLFKFYKMNFGENSIYPCIWGWTATLCLHSLIDGNFYHFQSLVFVAMGFGIIWGQLKLQNKQPHRHLYRFFLLIPTLILAGTILFWTSIQENDISKLTYDIQKQTKLGCLFFNDRYFYENEKFQDILIKEQIPQTCSFDHRTFNKTPTATFPHK